jgi:hypothetical protein
MKFRKLRIAWSVAWGVVAVLLGVLWVRSYWWKDNVLGRLSDHSAVYLESSRGGVGFSYVGSENKLIYEGWKVRTFKAIRITESRPLFSWSSHPMETTLLTPHWFAVALMAVPIAVPWLSWRYSLRTLLIATTVVAVVLGMIVWMSRAW